MILTVKDSGVFLEQPTKEVDPTSEEARETVDALLAAVQELDATVTDSRVAGLAANQIGHNSSIFVARLTLGADNELLPDLTVCINPTILYHIIPDKTVSSLLDSAVGVEGCYSLPGENYVVRRHMMVSLAYFDLEGTSHLVRLIGVPAIISQHEMDHLEGNHIAKIGVRAHQADAPPST